VTKRAAKVARRDIIPNRSWPCSRRRRLPSTIHQPRPWPWRNDIVARILGIFSQEREIIAIEALLKLKRRSEAIERAAAFSEAHPGSPHARRVRELQSRFAKTSVQSHDAAEAPSTRAPSTQTPTGEGP
jgi:hypothetical protein